MFLNDCGYYNLREKNVMVKKTTPVLIVLLLFFIPLVVAAPPVTETFVGDTGIEIKYPLIFFVKENKDLRLHFHLYNASTGSPILNDTAECYFHLYNDTGNHMYTEEHIRNTDNIFDFEVFLNGTNFTYHGDYDYVFQCNTSNSGGFVEVELQVTSDGKEQKENLSLIIALSAFAIVLIIGGLMLYLEREKS